MLTTLDWKMYFSDIIHCHADCFYITVTVQTLMLLVSIITFPCFEVYELHVMKLCHCALSWFSGFIWLIWPISFRVSSLALGQSHDCPSASEVTLKDMGHITQHQATTIHKNANCVHILRAILYISLHNATSINWLHLGSHQRNCALLFSISTTIKIIWRGISLLSCVQ